MDVESTVQQKSSSSPNFFIYCQEYGKQVLEFIEKGANI